MDNAQRTRRAPSDQRREASERRLGLWDTVSIIVGIVIGAGIYETAPTVMANVGSPLEVIGLWLVGGVLSLVGACCYSELASTYPKAGGDYVYLTRAYGSFVGFLFAWAQLSVIMTASIGMMAYVFANYAVALGAVAAEHAAPLAAAAVFALTLVNIAGVALGKAAQNLLSLAKYLGGLAVVGVGAYVVVFQGGTPSPDVSGARGEPIVGSIGLALILVLYTFGGWNDAAFVAREVKQVRRNLPRALLLGTLAITLIYLAMNAAFLGALGFESARASDAIATDLFRSVFGSGGAAFITLLVMVSALGAVNALIFTGARVHASLGADFSALSSLSKWHPRFGSPVVALVAQMVIAGLMILIVGTASGRNTLEGLLVWVGFAPRELSGQAGFTTLLTATAPVFWGFFLLTGVSVFVLRHKDKQTKRPFKVPLYPLTPLLFCGTSTFMLYSAVNYAGPLTALGAIPLLFGVPLYFASNRGKPRARAVGQSPVPMSAE